MPSIEEEIVQALSRAGALDGRSVARVLTGRLFVAVELDDGSVGTAMDYGRYPWRGEPRVEERAPDPPTPVRDFLVRPPAGLPSPDRAVRVAVLSACSQRGLTPEALAARGWTAAVVSYQEQRAPRGPNWARSALAAAVGGAARVGVVGYGGFMEMLAALPSVGSVLVCDRDSGDRSGAVRATVGRLNRLFGDKVRFVGEDTRPLEAESEVVQLTASALCNGSMDDLLDRFAGRPLLLVGPSGSVAPDPWFRRGCRLVCTERRDARFLTAYRHDDHLYKWFEEYDDRLYIVPGGPPGRT